MNGARENFLKSLVPCSPKSDTRGRFRLTKIYKQKGSLFMKKFVAWWNENHPDCQIKVDSIEEWTYRENEDPSSYNGPLE
ncbi:unnamed protein product [Rhizophagus irregularis]|nr:unnamed protein product [Rhizophagus irregularis]